MKFTIKLGKPGRSIAELLKKNHGLTGPIENWDGIAGSALYYGQAYESSPQWKAFIEDGAGEILPGLTNQGAAAILFVPSKDRFLVYVFGYGFLSVNDGFSEWDFGLKVVLNSISVNGIKSLDSHTINQKAKNKRIQVATQAGIGEFEVDILQDLVSQVSGKSIDTSFASNLTGGASLTMTVDMEGSSVARKSREIMRRYALNTYQNNFKWIDFIAPEKDPMVIEALDLLINSALNNLIAGTGSQEFVLSYPSIVELENLDYILFNGFGSSTEFDTVTVDDWVKEYQNAGYKTLAHDLSGLAIDLYDGHGKVFKSFPLYRCLTTEINYQSAIYILTSGTWFKLDADHFETVSHFFDDLVKGAEFRSGEQTNETTEQGYLKLPLAPGYELLDKDLYNAHGVRNTIEYGDIVNDQCEIIHVKDGGSSAKLSHLFNQGTVSARLLLTDKTFRSGMRSKITNGQTKALFPLTAVNSAKTTIVFRILKKGPVFSLPFFSKIILYDTYQKITAMGYKFRLDWVEYI